jgi:release factor glutamine methyltransferase
MAISAATASIKSAIDSATQRLTSTVTETPRLDAEVLMSFVLGCARARLLAHWDEPVDPAALARSHSLVERRAAGEPVAYIRNLKEFLGLEFYIDPRVLIPRPETELLVERAIQYAQQRPLTVVDLGTGSGAIAISLAKSRPQLEVIATDISAEVLEVARLNAKRHGVKVQFKQGSLLEPVDVPVDLVVANLPYLSSDEYRGLLNTSIAYEPRLALTDDADGLRLFDELFRQAARRHIGCLMLEIGSSQPEALKRLAADRLPAFDATVFADYAGLPRVLELIPSASGRGRG